MIHNILFFVLSIAVRQAVCQPVYAALQAEDYTVHATLVNRFVKCGDGQIRQYARPDERCLVFVHPTTDVQHVDEFRLNDLKEAARNGKLTSFRPDTAWISFLMSVRPDQFEKYTVANKLKLPSKQIFLWTKEFDSFYFNKTVQRPGYFGLRRDYKNFAAIVGFSNVVYSTDGKKAVCYFSAVSDGDTGAGYVVFLEKEAQTWLMVGSQMIWIA